MGLMGRTHSLGAARHRPSATVVGNPPCCIDLAKRGYIEWRSHVTYLRIE